MTSMSATGCRAAALITGSRSPVALNETRASRPPRSMHAGDAAELVGSTGCGELERHVPVGAAGDLGHVLDGDEPARRG